MNPPFDRNVYYGFFLKADLPAAIQYANSHPELEEDAKKFRCIFQEEIYPTSDLPTALSPIFLLYQKYYRNVFYLKLSPEIAVENLRSALAQVLQLSAEIDLEAIETEHLPQLFQSYGLHFLGGRTGGYYGPYIWTTSEETTYAVELPDGIQNYTVCFLDGFLSRSWLDYLSFGAISTGGWTNENGLIHCIRDSYDLESEAFTVSLLKHEAQHTMDLSINPNLSPTELEYRAKLVELIYSKERNLLPIFQAEADPTVPGHPQAAVRILQEYEKLSSLSSLSLSQIQETARKLFSLSRI